MNTYGTAADRWRGLLQRQESSGLSVAAFCRRAGVSQPSFYAWRRKLRDEVTFAEVKLPREMTAEAGGIEVRLPLGWCVVGRARCRSAQTAGRTGGALRKFQFKQFKAP